MASIRKRNGKWQVRINRDDISVTKTFANKKDGETWARLTEVSIERHEFTLKTKKTTETLGQLFDQYNDEVAPLHRSKTTSFMLASLKSRLGDVRVDSFRELSMPLPSMRLHGAKQCTTKSKRTGLPCNNPAAYGCRTCRMHGARKAESINRGEQHPNFVHGRSTLEAQAEKSAKSVMFRYLTDIGNHVNLFYTQLKTRGRPPSGYTQLDLTGSEQLALAILKTLPVNN